MLPNELVFVLAGAILLIGFLGNSLFKKTGLPDVLFLIFLGLLFGPILKIFPEDGLNQIAPYLTTLTFIMVLFNGGLEMKLVKVLKQSWRAIVLAITYFILVTIGIAALTYYVLGLDWPFALLFGPMVAGTSSVVILPMARKLGLSDSTSTTMILESVFTDVLNVVSLFALVAACLQGSLLVENVVQTLAQKLSTGLVFGVIMGVVWLKILTLLRNEEFLYMSTLAILLLAYEASEMIGGSGVLTVLAFGLILGNEESFRGLLGKSNADTNGAKEMLQKFQNELSFLMRTFFFFFLGLMYTTNGIGILEGILISVSILVINLALRYVAVWISTIRSDMKNDRVIITLLCGQGLAHAALSTVPLQMNLPNPYLYIVIVTNVILLTNIVTSVTAFYFKKNSDSTFNWLKEKE